MIRHPISCRGDSRIARVMTRFAAYIIWSLLALEESVTRNDSSVEDGKAIFGRKLRFLRHLSLTREGLTVGAIALISEHNSHRCYIAGEE